MARRRNETNQQWMERLQQYRADEMMDRTRAAVAFCNTSGNNEALKMSAFLDIFHPEIKPGTLQHIKLMQDARSSASWSRGCDGP